jgi:DNA polymerase
MRTLEEAAAEASACTKCRLAGGRTQVVYGVGNPAAGIMFIGEGPGYHEDKQGEPFVGAAGQLLNRMLGEIGLRREDVYIANVVKCRPPENRVPFPDEAKACLPYLVRQIRAIRPEVICTLGATALAHLLGAEERITRARGRWHSFEGIPVLPTYHPAFILRNAAREPEVHEDFEAIARRLSPA